MYIHIYIYIYVYTYIVAVNSAALESSWLNTEDFMAVWEKVAGAEGEEARIIYIYIEREICIHTYIHKYTHAYIHRYIDT